jgi:hypothetical protein
VPEKTQYSLSMHESDLALSVQSIAISCTIKGLSARLLDDVVLGGRVPGALQSVDHHRFPPLRQFEFIEDLEVL